jgi:serine phosphatase RsbU (regulator of sigma subunit)
MGLMPGLPLVQPPALDLAPGDIVGLMTDGIYEYENPSEEQFGESRVEEIVRQYQDEPMSRLVERIVASVKEFAEGAPQNDDMTILLARRLPD